MLVDDATGTIAWIGGDDAAAVHVDAVDEVVDLDGALVTPGVRRRARAHLRRPALALRGVDLAEHPQSLAEALEPGRGRRASAARAGRCSATAGTRAAGPRAGRRHRRRARPGVATAASSTSPGSTCHSAVVSSAPGRRGGAARPRRLGGRRPGRPRRPPRRPRGVQRAAVTPAQRAGRHRPGPAVGGRRRHRARPRERRRRTLGTDDFAERAGGGRSGATALRRSAYWAQLVADEAEARDVADAARRSRARRRPQRRRLDRLAHGAPARGRTPTRRDTAGNAYLDRRRRSATTSSPAPAPGCRPASTSSATPASPRRVAGFEAAAALVGAATVLRGRHRLEHVEMVSPRAASSASSALGVAASVQPAFDACWGGADGMYAARLGPDRARQRR